MIRRYCSQNLLVPNGDCCLRRVASLTLDKATIEKHVERPKYLPQELDFSLYEKFQGWYLKIDLLAFVVIVLDITMNYCGSIYRLDANYTHLYNETLLSLKTD